jgi:ABC-2 type transport system permease protein
MFTALLYKEWRALFVQPIAWVLLAIFLLIMGYTFATNLIATNMASLTRVVFQAALLLLLFVPLISMRAIAEERRHDTLELLLATRVTPADIVLAKFLATLAMCAALIAPTLLYPLVLALYGQPDLGPVVSGYAGLGLLAASLSALGIMLSALTASQVVAATIGIGMNLLLWLAETLAALIPPPWDDYVLHASTLAHFTPFATGALYLSDVAYFLVVTALGLVGATRALERR